MTKQTHPSTPSVERTSHRVSLRQTGWALYLVLLAGGAGVVIPRFFFDARADTWPDLLWTLSITGLYLSVGLLLKRRGSPVWRPWYALFVFAAVTSMATSGAAPSEVSSPRPRPHQSET